MNVFDFRDCLVADYAAYVTSFISIRDRRIRERVDQDLAEGLLWPEPSIGLNPSFAKTHIPGTPRGGRSASGAPHARFMSS